MAKFSVRTTEKGCRFNLIAGNGQVVGTSQTYKSRATCNKGIASVRKCAPEANVEDQTVEGFEVAKHPKFEIYLDKAGEFRFRLKASNGQAILASEGYTRKSSCQNGIESVRKNAPDAEVVEEE